MKLLACAGAVALWVAVPAALSPVLWAPAVAMAEEGSDDSAGDGDSDEGSGSDSDGDSGGGD